MRSRILIIEDHLGLAGNLFDVLELRGFIPDHAGSATAALKLMAEHRFDAILLDLGLPGIDGIEFLKRLRVSACEVPILVLTARDQLSDKLTAFAAGADDFLIKPADFLEVEARLHALLRRAGSLAEIEPPLEYGALYYDPQHCLVRIEDKTVLLTPTLGRLLHALMRVAPAVVSQANLFAQVWGREGFEANALHTQISKLRSLLDKPSAPSLISVERGVGYRISLAET